MMETITMQRRQLKKEGDEMVERQEKLKEQKEAFQLEAAERAQMLQEEKLAVDREVHELAQRQEKLKKQKEAFQLEVAELEKAEREVREAKEKCNREVLVVPNEIHKRHAHQSFYEQSPCDLQRRSNQRHQ